jgi:hypothetical protein
MVHICICTCEPMYMPRMRAHAARLRACGALAVGDAIGSVYARPCASQAGCMRLLHAHSCSTLPARTSIRIRPRHRHSSTTRRRRGERSVGLGDVRPRRLVVPAVGASMSSSLAWKFVGLLTLPPIPEALIPLPTVPRQGTAGRSRAWAVSMSIDAVVGASRRTCLHVELVGGVDRNRSRYRIRSQQQLLVSEFLLISIASVDRRL